MNDKIKIDIVSDVVCPWCIIGYKRLAQAIQELGLEDKIEVEWQPFELNPNMPTEGEEIVAHIARKYGSTPAQSAESRRHITALGAELGFSFDFFEGMHIVNTQNAHILLEYAKTFGKQTELKLYLIQAYFTNHQDVSNRTVLISILEKVGLNVEGALAQLDNLEARQQVRAHEGYWHGLGVSSVPTIVFNRASALVGAQPVETYKQVLSDLIQQQS